MALKGSREEFITTNTYRMNEVEEAGGVVWVSTVGSGIGLDSAVQLATANEVPTSGSSRMLGILMCDVVNNDQTKQHGNWHKDEVQQGNPVRILRDGWVVTNKIFPGITPAANEAAFGASGGYISNNGFDPATEIGFFETTKDEDGYATVYVKLPMRSYPKV